MIILYDNHRNYSIVNVPNEALVGGILGGSFIITIMAVAAIGGMLAYRKKKLQANCNKNDFNV